jgi:hypothetical protein
MMMVMTNSSTEMKKKQNKEYEEKRVQFKMMASKITSCDGESLLTLC